MERSRQPSEPVSHQGVNVDDLVSGGENKFTGLQLFFLRRLLRLVKTRQEQSNRLNNEGLRLLDRAIFSTYCDCLDQGVGSAAQAIIHQIMPVQDDGTSYQTADESGRHQ